MGAKVLKICLVTFFLAFNLSGCQEIKGLLGVEEDVFDFPPGEYIGKAKLIGDIANTAIGNGSTKTANGANLAAAVEANKTAKAEVKTPEPAKDATAASKEAAANATQGAELKESEAKTEETGVLKEAPVLIDPLENIPGQKIKITFLPKDKGITDGIGILLINEASHRFVWRTNGNNKDTWNVLFTKDNNIYSNLQHNFNFDGVITSSSIENKIVGRLYIDNDSKISEYYIEAYQLFKPKIIPPKEAMAIKGGDDIVIDVEKIGDNPDDVRAILNGIPSEKQQASINELKVKNIEYDPKKGIYKVYIMTTKSLGKGEYSLYLIRSGAYKSNSIPIKV